MFLQLVIVVLSAYLMLTIAAMICVVHYRNSRNRKDKRQLVLVEKWEIYIKYIFCSEPSLSNVRIKQKSLHKLHSIEELMAFALASKKYIDARNSEIKRNFRQFIYENKTVWMELGASYHKREQIKKAYFASLCEQIFIIEPAIRADIAKLMLEYVLVPSIYCRENALNTLYAIGNKEVIIEAFQKLSIQNIFHNHKLITDGLLKYTGNKEELVRGLYQYFEQFSLEYQIAILDYFRFSGEILKYELKNLLVRKVLDKEIVCSLLRYYKKYLVLDYKNIILSRLMHSPENDWECISSAASTLGKYPGTDTISALKSALSSKYWYVRWNAAQSLSELHVENAMVQDVLNGNDRYAKEQLSYHLNHAEG